MADNSSRLWGMGGFREDDYVRVDHLDEAGNRSAILPLASWLLAVEKMPVETRARTGVFVAAAEAIDALVPYLPAIKLIALDFPVFHDGRSYSKAVQLRSVYHYRSELRAVGDVLIDQVSPMLRCGFDALEVTHPLTLARLAAGGNTFFPGFYQPGAGLARAGPQRVWRPVKTAL